jgi:hypothetical protein
LFKNMVFRVNNFSSFFNFGQSNRSSQNSSSNSFTRSTSSLLNRVNSSQVPAKPENPDDAFKIKATATFSDNSYIKERAIEAIARISELKEALNNLEASDPTSYLKKVDQLNQEIEDILKYKQDGKTLIGADPNNARVVVANYTALTNTSKYSTREAHNQFAETGELRAALTSTLSTDLASIGLTRNKIEADKEAYEKAEESRKALERLKLSREKRAGKGGGSGGKGSDNSSMFINNPSADDSEDSTVSTPSNSSSPNQTSTNSETAAPAVWTAKMTGFGTAYIYDATKDQQPGGGGDGDVVPVEGDGGGDGNVAPVEGDGGGDGDAVPVEGDGGGDGGVAPVEGDGGGDGDVAPVGDGDVGGAEGPAVGTFYMEKGNLYLMSEGGPVQYFQTGMAYESLMIDEYTAIVGSNYDEIQTGPDSAIAYVWTAVVTEKGGDGWVEYSAQEIA